MKKIIAVFLISILLVAFCCSCSKNGGDIIEPSIDITSQAVRGNTNGNLLCSGLFAQKNNQVYFATNGLYRISDTGDDWAQVYDGAAAGINITDSSIYCTIEGENSNRMIHKINTETGEAVKLADDDVQSLIVVDDYIYFSSKSENGIFKMDLSGGNRAKLYDAYAWNISYDNGYLYFVAEDAKYNVHKIDINGENHSVIYDGEVISAVVDGGKVYFSSMSENAMGIYMIDESNKPVAIVNTIPMRMNVYSNYVYYTTEEGLFRCDSDGKNVIQLAVGSINHIYTGGGYVYYTLNSTGTSKLYRIKTDGSNNELFLTLVVSE